MRTFNYFLSMFLSIVVFFCVSYQKAFTQDYIQTTKLPTSMHISHLGSLSVGCTTNVGLLSIRNTSQLIPTSFRVYSNHTDSTDFAVNKNGSVRIGGVINHNQRPKLQIVAINKPGIYLDHKSSGSYEHGFAIRIDNNLTKAISIADTAGNNVFLVYGSGNVHANHIMARKIEVRIDALQAKSWPDYVFESDYRLMTLNELEAFINENAHLPSIPKRDDLENSNIDLLNLNMLLLQKIEELTLYTISLQKQLDSLKNE